ncbi:IclR family transcriptional regulator [Nocardia tengchongensis]|uniref:IclR family transcriptional regulator n=1 Tax=Nocardia tengchongensis TaxID=2055889 RepID=A0ABX8CH76_9NOCA|nr:IclR family transcriptional regulator [Nocardia tengchongensis]
MEAVADNDFPLSVSELSQRTGLPLPTVSRTVSELVEREWLRRDMTRRVDIGPRVWELANRRAPFHDLRALAIPYMNRLSAQVGRNVGLSVRQQREVLCIERVSAPGVFSAVPRPAERLPLHRSAAGLVLLAYAPNTVQRAMFSKPLHPYAQPGTVPATRPLREQLDEIRRRGVAHYSGSTDPNTISVPIWSDTGTVVAALSTMPPADGRDPSNVYALARITAHLIGRALSAAGAVLEGDASGELADVPDHAAQLGAAVVEAVGDRRDRQFAVGHRAGDEL